MSLIDTKEMLCKAQKEHYAVGAFNAENMEMVQAIIEAAEEMNSPVIIQTTPSTITYADTNMFYGMVHAIAKDARVPVALHLDHGDSFDLCQQAVLSGYTSVMIDGSKLPFEENIDICARVVAMAVTKGKSVEAELGTIGGKEDSTVVYDKDAL
jgi:ketose-bisphosphate aldolase